MKKNIWRLLIGSAVPVLLTACGNVETNQSAETDIVMGEDMDIPVIDAYEGEQDWEETYVWEEEPKKVTESVPAQKGYQYINKDYTSDSAVLLRMKYDDYQMGDKFWVCKYEGEGENILDTVVNIRESFISDFELYKYAPTHNEWGVEYYANEDTTEYSRIATKGTYWDAKEDVIVENYGNGWILAENTEYNTKGLYYYTEEENGVPVLDYDSALCFWAGNEVEFTEEKVNEIMSKVSFYEVSKDDMFHGKDMHTGEIIDLSPYAYVDDLIGEQLNELGLCIDYRTLDQYSQQVSVCHSVLTEEGYTNKYKLDIQYLDIPREEYDADLTKFKSFGKLGNYDIEIGKMEAKYYALLSYDGQIVFSIKNDISADENYDSATEMYVAIAKYIFSEDISDIGTWKEFMSEENKPFAYANMSVTSGYEPINSEWTDKNTFLFRVGKESQDTYYVASCTLPRECVGTLQLNERGEFESNSGKMWITQYATVGHGKCISMYFCMESGEIIPYNMIWKEIVLEELDMIQDYGNGWILANDTEDFAYLYFDFSYGSESEPYCLAIPIHLSDENGEQEEYIRQRADLYMSMLRFYEVDQDDMLAGVDLLTDQSADLSPYAYLDDILISEFMKFGVVVPDYTHFSEWERENGLTCLFGEKEYRIEIIDKPKSYAYLSDEEERYSTLRDYDVYQYDEYGCYFAVDDLVVLFIRRWDGEESSFEETMDDMIADLFYEY